MELSDQTHCVGVCQWDRARDPVADRCRHKKIRQASVHLRCTTVIGFRLKRFCFEGKQFAFLLHRMKFDDVQIRRVER